MRFQKRGRLGTKIVMKCHSCKLECQPKDGDWHDGVDNQIFLCRPCEAGHSAAKRPVLHKKPAASQLRA